VVFPLVPVTAITVICLRRAAVKRRRESASARTGVGHGDEYPLSGHGFPRQCGGPALQSVIDVIMAASAARPAWPRRPPRDARPGAVVQRDHLGTLVPQSGHGGRFKTAMREASLIRGLRPPARLAAFSVTAVAARSDS